MFQLNFLARYNRILTRLRVGLPRHAVLTALVLPLLLRPAAGDTNALLDIHSPAQLDAKRAALIRYTWGTAWEDVLARQPTTVQSPYNPVAADALPPVPTAQKIEQLV